MISAKRIGHLPIAAMHQATLPYEAEWEPAPFQKPSKIDASATLISLTKTRTEKLSML